MTASCSLLGGSTKRWNSQPLNCRQKLSAFLSKPHFANPRGSLSGRLSVAEDAFTLSTYSKLSTICFSRKSRSLSYLGSSHFGSFWSRRSNLFLTLSKTRRRTFAVPSAGDSVLLETLWTPLVKAFMFHGGDFPRMMLFLSDIFSDASSNSLLYSFTLVTTILGVSGAFYAQASREREAIRQNLAESDQKSESRQSEGFTNWLNLSKPTPFNRFVAARCPSLSRPLGGRYSRNAEFESNQAVDPPEYQRLCLHALDGGTVALDWPSHLDLETNKELENVLIIIPGSTEGSEEKGVGKFTRIAEQRGFFPMVLNPRGCGRSPLTTPRVFSAADSDDVRLVARYIAKRRPWATIMGIGWGFGANMLLKYLGEEAYATPLTAAVCIDNPFSLDKVTQSAPASRWGSLDHELTTGLVNILDANKKLFLGDNRGFDVSGGLAATSLSAFETAISMVAHGYDSLQKFYEDNSSQATIEKVQIPVSCIQHVQDYMGHQISISQEAFEKNPYTMLLVSPSDIEESTEDPQFPGTASEWSHATSLEWLAAVEVALLKGRHPLLNVVDLTVKPSKEWSPVGSQIASTASSTPVSEPATKTLVHASHTYDIVDSEIIDVTGDISDLSEHPKVLAQESSMKPSVEASEQKPHRDDDVSKEISRQDHAIIVGRSGDAVKSHTQVAVKEPSEEENRKNVETEEQENPEEVETGQVQLAAESVMKVLDVTMPGTLSAQQKQQVLEAVGRGETLVGALQEAVPEDVRGKISSAVSAAVQAKGISLKTAGFGEKIPAPNLPAGLTESLKEKLAGLTGSQGHSNPDHSLPGSPEKKGSDDGRKVESKTRSDTTTHESSESSAEKNLPAKTGSDGNKSGVDLNKDPVAQNDHPPHYASEDHTDKSRTTGINSDDSKGSDDTKKDPSGAQGEHPSVATSDPTQAAKTSSDGTKSTDDRKRDAALPHNEQASHENSDDIARQAQDTKANHDDQKVHEGGKPEEKADEKDSSAASTNGQAPANIKESDAATDSRNKGDDGSNDSADVVKEDFMKAPGQEGEKKNEQPGVTENVSEHKEEPNKHEPNSPSQTDNHGQSSDSSESKGETSPSPNDEAQQKPQNDAPAVENSVPAPVPSQPPVHDPVPPVPSIGQALQALTGFDDATQMAVANVFSVVENVLDQLERDNPHVEKSPTTTERKNQEGKRKRARTRGTAHETGDSDSEGEPEKDFHDVSDSDSDDELENVLDSRASSMSRDKRGAANESHGGSLTQSASTNSQDGDRNSSDERVLNHGDRGQEVNGQFEDQGSFQELRNGSLRSNGGTGAIRLFADKGQQKYVRRSKSGIVNMQGARNDFMVDDNDEPRSVSVVVRNRNQAKTSVPPRESPHSLTLSDDGNEIRLEAIAAEIDQEDEDNAKKVSETDRSKHAEGNEDDNVVKDVVMNALKLEVVRRLRDAGMDALGLDLEEELSKVAQAVSEAVKQGQESLLEFASEKEVGGGGEREANQQPDSTGKLGTLNGSNIVRTLGSVIGSTSALGSLIPLGVLVGVVLAALGALFLLVTEDHDEEKNAQSVATSSSESSKTSSSSDEFDKLASENTLGQVSESNSDAQLEQGGSEKSSENISSFEKENPGAEEDIVQADAESTGEHESEDVEGPPHGKIMGALTAAMGATAAVASQSQASTAVHSEQTHWTGSNETDGSEAQGAHDSGDGNSKPKFVPEIAEKAISMVSPVVPKKEDGEVDQDRLVAMLAEIGQRGGILTLVGKAALLWGGLRGAMSLADRLLGFLRIKDRPLQQRLLGFLGMALLLWTPVLVPLLPTLLEQWATNSPTGVADAAAGIGLYGAVFILITIWGKRVRGYDRPLVAYGLQMLSRAELRFVGVGMAIGVNLVTAYYGINWALGYSQFSWASIVVENPSFPGPVATAILTSWKFISLIGQSVSMALIVALVEELLFRAWLQEEIAVDLGFHWAILLSALAFALVHWSPPAMVGLWLLSVALAGARSRMDGDLSLPIGIHAGIVAAFSVVNLGGLAPYSPAAPAWFTGAYAGNPLAGALGTAMVAALAIGFYPRKFVLPPAEEDDCDDYDDDS